MRNYLKPSGISRITEHENGSITVWIGPAEKEWSFIRELGIESYHQLSYLNDNQKDILRSKTGLVVRRNVGLEYGIHMNVIDIDQFQKYLDNQLILRK